MVIAPLVVTLQQSGVSTRIREENQRTRVHNLLKLDIGRSEASKSLFIKSLSMKYLSIFSYVSCRNPLSYVPFLRTLR